MKTRRDCGACVLCGNQHATLCKPPDTGDNPGPKPWVGVGHNPPEKI